MRQASLLVDMKGQVENNNYTLNLAFSLPFTSEQTRGINTWYSLQTTDVQITLTQSQTQNLRSTTYNS